MEEDVEHAEGELQTGTEAPQGEAVSFTGDSAALVVAVVTADRSLT